MDGEGSVLPEGWIAAATTKQKDIGLPGRGYGYQWWTLDDGSFMALGIFGQGIFIDPTRNLVLAFNSSWRSANGDRDGEAERRMRFFETVKSAVDRELAAQGRH